MKSALGHGFADAIDTTNLKYFGYSALILLFSVIPLYLLIANGVQELFGYAGIDDGEGWLFWLAHFISHVLIVTLGYFLFVPLMFLITTFFSEKIIENIRTKHYPQLELPHGISTIDTVVLTLWILLKYTALLVVASPLLLLFGLGHFIFAIFGFIVFRKMLLLDVLSPYRDATQISADSSLLSGGKYMVSTLTLYLFSLVPGINLLVPFFAVCYITHLSFEHLSQQTSSPPPA